jgi:aerobic-type carbon monoxide dehydrogenase small subunit (CoxS/CutS family)
MAEQNFDVCLNVNGVAVDARVPGRTLLIDFLRRNAALTGPRFGCEDGSCGACTVDLNGATVKSCLMLAVQAQGQHITTAEGLAQDGELSKVQQAFMPCNAAIARPAWS